MRAARARAAERDGVRRAVHKRGPWRRGGDGPRRAAAAGRPRDSAHAAWTAGRGLRGRRWAGLWIPQVNLNVEFRFTHPVLRPLLRGSKVTMGAPSPS